MARRRKTQVTAAAMAVLAMLSAPRTAAAITGEREGGKAWWGVRGGDGRHSTGLALRGRTPAEARA
jgi:hypothetical protein